MYKQNCVKTKQIPHLNNVNYSSKWTLLGVFLNQFEPCNCTLSNELF